MKRQKILNIALILTVAICLTLGVADYRLTQEIQELEENLGLYQDGVRIEKVEGADSDKDEPETAGSEI
jgi:cell division protein FtsX